LDKQTFEACRDSVDPPKAGGCYGNEFAAMKDYLYWSRNVVEIGFQRHVNVPYLSCAVQHYYRSGSISIVTPYRQIDP